MPFNTLVPGVAAHLQVQRAQAQGQGPGDGIQQVIGQVEELQLLQCLGRRQRRRGAGGLCGALGVRGAEVTPFLHSWARLLGLRQVPGPELGASGTAHLLPLDAEGTAAVAERHEVAQQCQGDSGRSKQGAGTAGKQASRTFWPSSTPLLSEGTFPSEKSPEKKNNLQMLNLDQIWRARLGDTWTSMRRVTGTMEKVVRVSVTAGVSASLTALSVPPLGLPPGLPGPLNGQPRGPYPCHAFSPSC